MNKNIYQSLEYANNLSVRRKNFLNDESVINFWNNKDNYTWKDICEFSRLTINGRVILTKFSYDMLIYLLENDLYNAEFKDKLLTDLPNIKKLNNEFKSAAANLFDEHYETVHFVNGMGKNKGISVRKFANGNKFMTDLYIDFVNSTKDKNHLFNADMDYIFPLSIGNINVQNYKDIDSNVFWNQINYYKEHYKNNARDKSIAVSNICKFYRWLVRKYENYDFFKNSLNLTNELLLSSSLVKNINRDAYFTTYTQTEEINNEKVICFIIRNLDNYSVRKLKNDYFILDTSKLKASFYRNIVIKYVQNATSPSITTSNSQIIYIINMLNFIEKIKSQKNYPNPHLDSFNTQESVMIRDYYRITFSKNELSTLNNKIGSARRFFQWCMKSNYLSFTDTFFDYLSQYEEPNKSSGDAIPDEDLELINKEFINICKSDATFKPYYAIFLLLVETEFRVSQICNLKVDCLQPTLKNDQFLIVSNTKTSHGRKSSQPICASTKHILDSVMEDTEELRNKAIQESIKKHIFLRIGKNIAEIMPISIENFLDVFKKICEKAGVRKYTSRNLRDTHMTKAFEFILKNGKSDLEMGILSKHKYIDTTKSHYIEIELTKMLESTYQVLLEKRTEYQRKRVLRNLPPELSDNKSIVENGCGRCKAKMCHMVGSLPCLVCKDFVTTVDHKQYFIKMIQNVDLLLSKTTIKHEIEDLNLIKTLYVAWLREILLTEEEEEEL